MRKICFGILLVALVSVGTVFSACSSASEPPASEPVSISILTYYNGEQLNALQRLVQEYNSTQGAEKQVSVSVSNVGSVNDLRDSVMESARGKVGANPLPNMFMAYADTAYAIDQMGLLVDMAPYLSAEERELYVDGYLEEGSLGESDSIKIFPVAKSTEVFVLNKTDFDAFAQETGATYDDLRTVEGLVRVSQSYYEWTDAQTSQPDDGKAFFGRDAMANYFFIGAKQLGCSILSVEDGKASLDFDKKVVRKLWDNYYVPFVKGYFAAQGAYRSDDAKTGTIIALVGSSSGATYFPSSVVDVDGTERPIEAAILPSPQFEGADPTAVQQGAGVAVIDSTPEEVQASVDFLKWLTAPAQNLQLSVSSGYLPVTKEANSMDAVHAAHLDLDGRMEQILEVAMAEVTNNDLYTPHAFENGTSLRNILDYSLQDLASSDYHAVAQLVESGISRDEALKPFLSDDHFEEWYKDTSEQLEALL